MIREEKRWIAPEPVVLPEFVGEVQEETTAGAVAGEDMTLDGGGGKGSPATEPATAPATEPATEPAYATSPATEKSPQTMPQGVGSLPNVVKPLGRSKGAEPITNAVKEPVAPKQKISDFFGELSAAATGGKVGVEGSVEALKRIGVGEGTAKGIVKGTQALGVAEVALLTAASPVGAKVASDVQSLSEAVSKGAQSLSLLDKARALLGGAY